MKNQIVAFLSENPDLNTFADIRKHISGFDGDKSLVHSKFKNVVYWINMSQTAIDAFVSLFDEGRIEFSQCEPGIYEVAGKSLLGIFKTTYELKRHSSEHWYPVKITLRQPGKSKS